MSAITFVVFGTAKPKGSTRAFQRGRKIVVTSDNPSLKGWESVVRYEAQRIARQAGHRLFDGAVAISAVFHLTRPKSVSVRKRPFHVTRPDADKLARGLIDPLTGILWRDDAQVVHLSATKLYTDGPARAVVTVRPVLVAADLPGGVDHV